MAFEYQTVFGLSDVFEHYWMFSDTIQNMYLLTTVHSLQSNNYLQWGSKIQSFEIGKHLNPEFLKVGFEMAFDKMVKL